MAASNFARSLSLVLEHEGGYVNHPKDPGGATNKGITQMTYDAWRKRRKKATQSVKAITESEVAAIYRADYWDRVRGDALPAGLDYAVFDYGVNSGPDRAIKALQKVLLVPADGAVGPVTLQAAATAIPTTVIDAICDERMAFLKRLSTWGTFGKGWTRRVTDVRAAARAMAGAAVPPAPFPPPPDIEPVAPAQEPQEGRLGWPGYLAIFGVVAAVAVIAIAIFVL